MQLSAPAPKALFLAQTLSWQAPRLHHRPAVAGTTGPKTAIIVMPHIGDPHSSRSTVPAGFVDYSG
jgi:hypothetical protein